MRAQVPARTTPFSPCASAPKKYLNPFVLWIFYTGLILIGSNGKAQAQNPTNLFPHFVVERYEIAGGLRLTTNITAPILSKYTGTNVGLDEVVRAAADLQSAYQSEDHPGMSVAIAKEEITNGVVTMNVYQGARPQILVSGVPYTVTGNRVSFPGMPVMVETNVTPRTNDLQHFVLTAYEVTGNTLLSEDTLNNILSKHTGTNATIMDIQEAMKELQLEYRTRRYPTVAVVFPEQKNLDATNAIVKLQVIEGTLAEITVTGNRYYSSNNVMAALPILQTNMILNDALFQAELDRANANQDRQIYPKIEPGPDPNTSALRLEVRDRLPLHAKVDFNNQSSPGTPEFRINSSAVYNNLWQMNHSIGAQYSFSPTDYKTGNQWNFYDQPLIANYSFFYRMPWGDPGSVADQVAASPGTFGYSEATRRFNLPPASGAPELNFYASRSTIDTGVLPVVDETIQDIPGVLTIKRKDEQQDLTVNNAAGFRIRKPLPEIAGISSSFSFGGDFKTYDLKSYKTNEFFFTLFIRDAGGTVTESNFTVISPVPVTHHAVSYFPLSLSWDASKSDGSNTWSFGAGYSGNVIGGTEEREEKFEDVAGSAQATGLYHILTANLSRDQYLYHDWRISLRADGQWASQPLISNEQYGNGGINGVRGYREAEVFGDTGWRITSELKTPERYVGQIPSGAPLKVRGGVFMDYGQVFLLDPQGRDSRTILWGTGVGFAATLGPSFEAKFLFGIPLLSTTTTSAGEVRIDFSLSAQF